MYLGQSNYIDVRTHGAKLDGVTDDTDAFLLAIEAANNGSGRLYIPPVTNSYYDGGGLTITPVEINPRRITIFGANQGAFNSGLESKTSCIKLKNGSSGDLITLTGGAGTTAQNIRFENLKLDGNKLNCTGISHGIYLPTVAVGEDSFVEIDHCFLQDFTGDCVNSEYGRRGTKIHHTKMWESRNGWNCASSDGWLDTCDIGRMSEDGVQIHDWTTSITANNIFSCRNGINIYAGEGALTSIVGNRIDRHQFSGIRSYGVHTSMVGNMFHRNSESGAYAASHILIGGTENTAIGNTFKDGSGAGYLCAYDISLDAGIAAVVSGNTTRGRGYSSAYGHIGRATGSRVLLSFGEYDQSARSYVSEVVDSAASIAFTLTAGYLRNEIIRRTGTAAGAIIDTTDTASNIVTDIGLPFSILNNSIGSALKYRYVNQTGQQITIAAGAGVTLTGTMTVANNAWRDFTLHINSSSAVTITNIGGGNL